MATKKKLLQAAAGVGGAGLNVEEVFSTYLYDGNGSTQTITNGIDLAGEGGLVWIKNRTDAFSHYLTDTERGTNSQLSSDLTSTAATSSVRVTGFNADGFDLGGNGATNGSLDAIASWTFRKAPKFFDVVTYTGNGTAGREIAHNLDATVGAIIIKRTDTTSDWAVFHRAAGENLYYKLNTADGYQVSGTIWDATLPTSTVFTVGSDAIVNASGGTYVAYLFAHNNGDGDFGDGTQDIIKCGSYGGNSSTTGPVINLGFEPQWLLVRRGSVTGEYWQIVDNMRGVVTGGNDSILYPNATNAEVSTDVVDFNATGFQPKTTSASWNASGNTYIYIAIRRGPMAVPESATDVFAIDLYTGNTSAKLLSSGFPVDTLIGKDRDAIGSINTHVFDRMRGQPDLRTSGTSAEASSSNTNFDRMDGVYLSGSNDINFGGGDHVAHMWRRAPNFFDVVAYTGTGSNQTISHNLGVAPKFIIVKERTTANNWVCYLEALGNDKRMGLNAASSVATDTTAWQSTTPTDSAFYVGANSQTNVSGEDFIAYLFGEVSGISKFGTYTGTGAAQNIDCGFSSGARFVLTKTYAGTNPNADWNIWDSERGIVAGNDPYLALNSTNAEVTSTDVIDPYSSGFSLTSSGVANNSGTSYWFYAIA